MWILKFRARDKGCIWSSRTGRYGIYDYQYELATYRKGRRQRVVSAHILSGEPKRQEQYIEAVRKDKRVLKIERERNFFVAVTEEPLWRMAHVYANPVLLFIKPIINTPEGCEEWEVGSYEKGVLVELWKVVRKLYNGEQFSLKRRKIHGLLISMLSPRLSEKQREALNLAIDKNYYSFPRGATLEELARLTKVSRPAYEERLRRGERKLMEFMKQIRL